MEKEEGRLIRTEASDAVPVSSTIGTYTIDEALTAAGVGRYQYLLLLYVGFAWMCDAMEMMLLSFLAPAASCEWDLSSMEKGAITSVVFVGMFVGAYLWGVLGDNEGRKIGFLAPAVFTAIWGFSSAAAPNYTGLLIFRGLVGLGIGGIHVAFSLFLEFVPTEQRGRFAILVQAFWTIGALTEAALAWAILPTMGWRYLLGFSTIPFAVLLIFFPFLSESPRFLALKGKQLRAEHVLARVAKWNGRELPEGKLIVRSPAPVYTESKNLTYHLKKVASGMSRGLAELVSSALRRRTLLLFVIWFVHAMMYYGIVLLTTELQSKNTEECSADGELELEKSDYLEIFIDTAAETVGFTIAFFTVDSLGRRRTMMLLLFACTMSLWPLTLSTNDIYQTALLFAARTSISGSFNALFVFTPELFPTDVRTFGMGICNAFSRFGGLAAPLFAVHLVDEGHSSVVELLFSGLCLVALTAVYFIPVETMGKALDDTIEIEMASQPAVPQNLGDIPSDEEIQRL